MSTPSGSLTYRHAGPNYASSGSVWMVGLLMSKTLGLAQAETYVWDKQTISGESYSRPGAFVTKVDLGQTNAPVLQRRVIVRDGATHDTTYGNFDSYGNPRSVVEFGPGGGSRSSTLSYYVNTGKWIVLQLQNESFQGHSVTRTFDTNGNLVSMNRNGVTTGYGYGTGGVLTSITFPRGLVHSYSNHKRGIARHETQPEGVTLTRQVDEAGNVTAETNGDGLGCGVTFIPPDRYDPAKPFDLSWWRGAARQSPMWSCRATTTPRKHEIRRFEVGGRRHRPERSVRLAQAPYLARA